MVLVYSKLPTGYARWIFKFLANVKRFPTRKWQVFSKKELKPHLERTWSIGKLNNRNLKRMEYIFMLYTLPMI